MIWRAMRLTGGLKLSALVALAVPALLGLTAITTLADSSPTPSASPVLPGDPSKGATLYATNCQSCHGASLEGGIGVRLSPIDTSLKGVTNPLDPAFLIDIITNGRLPQPGDPKSTPMPSKGGNAKLTDQDVKDLAAFIISNQNPGILPYSPGELAKRTMFWVGVGIIAMIFVTYLLAQYNMRWIARRAAARRK